MKPPTEREQASKAPTLWQAHLVAQIIVLLLGARQLALQAPVVAAHPGQLLGSATPLLFAVVQALLQLLDSGLHKQRVEPAPSGQAEQGMTA